MSVLIFQFIPPYPFLGNHKFCFLHCDSVKSVTCFFTHNINWMISVVTIDLVAYLNGLKSPLSEWLLLSTVNIYVICLWGNSNWLSTHIIWYNVWGFSRQFWVVAGLSPYLHIALKSKVICLAFSKNPTPNLGGLNNRITCISYSFLDEKFKHTGMACSALNIWIPSLKTEIKGQSYTIAVCRKIK